MKREKEPFKYRRKLLVPYAFIARHLYHNIIYKLDFVIHIIKSDYDKNNNQSNLCMN